MNSRGALTLFVGVFAVLSACAKVPRDRYGVDRIRLHGVEAVDPYALRACLATAQRDRLTINLGRTRVPECNAPPFDPTTRLRIPLWRRGWPLFDRNVFERDVLRVERFYRARGYYDAQVVAVTFDPPIAATEDRVPEDAPCDRLGADEGCAVDLQVTVEEGEPVLVGSIQVSGVPEGSSLQRSLQSG